VDVTQSCPWIDRVFVYPHARVRLNFFRVTRWSGEPHAVEHERLAWQPPHAVDVEPMLPANGPVLAGLSLPPEYAISQVHELGREVFMSRLARRLQEGLRLIQLREPRLSRGEFEQFAEQAIQLAHAAGARVLINGDVDLALRLSADGVHLAARRVAVLARRPDLPLVGASCHDAGELRAAEALGADFAVLGPVHPTPTHPGSSVLGWHGFARAVRGTAIPVYALGGVISSDVEIACSHGAHGIAMIRGAWQ
jgi:8-oxo-dGTP diphosphatase